MDDQRLVADGGQVQDGIERPGELERFAIECALDAAWATEFWIPGDPDYGFVDYLEAAAARNIGLIHGFEDLAEDVARRGILPQTDSDQATLVTDGGRQVRQGIVGSCTLCDGQMIETTSSKREGVGHIGLTCQDCGDQGRIEYLVGEENPWQNPSGRRGVIDTTVKQISWIDCPRCHGHGWIEDPLCDLRRAMNGREHPCPECHTSGSVPRIVESDGGSWDNTDQRDPADDPRACSRCGVHIGALGSDYCDPCARELGDKPPLRRCVHCGQRGPQDQMNSFDVSSEDELYPEIRYLCRGCSDGDQGD